MYYRLIGDNENFRNYIMVGYTQDYANMFDGRSHKSTYKKTEFKLTKETESTYPIADFIGVGYIPLCSKKMKGVLETVCEKDEIEFLPCKLEGINDDFYIMNVLGLEDCVNYEESDYETFKSSDRIMFFNKIKLKKEIQRHVFRIIDLPYCNYFVSEKVKNKLESAGLKGLKFDNTMFN